MLEDLPGTVDTYESLEEGDRIELPEYYENAMTVNFVGDDIPMVAVEDDRGNERTLMQSTESPSSIGLIVGRNDKGDVTEINKR